MEQVMQAKLVETKEVAAKQRETLQKALKKQKEDIDIVMEMNETLKIKQTRLEEKNKKLNDELTKEKDKRNSIVNSLNATDTEKVRTSQRLQI